MSLMEGASAPREILLVDDHAIVREGVRSLFEDEAGWAVVAEAGSGDEAVQALSTRSADLAIMDLRMPGLAPAATITMMRSLRPRLRVLVLTSFFVEAEIQAVLSAGANGLVLKDAARADIVAAAHAVVDGDTWIQPSLLSRVMHLLTRSSAQRQLLGRRELQVLDLLGQGLSNKRIAAMLGIAEGTVKGYLREIFPKIGVSDRLQAALYARGLLHEGSTAAGS